MAKRGTNPEATRTHIRAVTAALCKDNGVHATSLGDIAKAAGISKGTLYYHYPVKDELILEIAEEHFEKPSNDLFAWIELLNHNAAPDVAVQVLTEALLSDPERLRLHVALLCESLRTESPLHAWMRVKQKEWAMLLELGAIKMSMPAAQKFRQYGKLYFSLLDGFALHMLMQGSADISLLHDMLALEDK